MVDLETINAYMARVTETETVVHKPVSDKLKVGVDLGTAYIVIVVLDGTTILLPVKSNLHRCLRTA